MEILQSLDLQPLPNAPCIYTGHTLKDHPPLYLGLYVDDFVYFSESDEVEQEFQRRLGAKVTTDFMGPVTHFLGHKFQCEKYTVDDTP